MQVTYQAQIGTDRFCVMPHLEEFGGVVYRIVPLASTSCLTLEVCEGKAAGTRFPLGLHLVKHYRAVQLRDPAARFNGTLELNCACKMTPDGFIEPSGSVRKL